MLKSETLVGRIHAVDQDNGNDGAIHYRFVFDNQPREDEQALTSDDFSIDSQASIILFSIIYLNYIDWRNSHNGRSLLRALG